MRAYVSSELGPELLYYSASDVEKLISLLRQYRQVHDHASAGGHLCSICEDTDKTFGVTRISNPGGYCTCGHTIEAHLSGHSMEPSGWKCQYCSKCQGFKDTDKALGAPAKEPEYTIECGYNYPMTDLVCRLDHGHTGWHRTSDNQLFSSPDASPRLNIRKT